MVFVTLSPAEKNLALDVEPELLDPNMKIPVRLRDSTLARMRPQPTRTNPTALRCVRCGATGVSLESADDQGHFKCFGGC